MPVQGMAGVALDREGRVEASPAAPDQGQTAEFVLIVLSAFVAVARDATTTAELV